MHREERGTALVTVLLTSAVLLVVCFSLATIAMLNLNLAGSYSTRTQGLLVAEAVVNQVVAELEKAQQNETGGATEAPPQSPIDLVARFQSPVFPTGGERFPAEAIVTFDRTLEHFSVDNSYNGQPAAGWLDRGTSRRSVPPFSIDLIVGVKAGDRTTWYQAVLRRRWPYVLTTPGKVTMMGAPTYAMNHATTTVAPTEILGNIFDLPGVSFNPPPPSPRPGEPPPPPVRDDGSAVFVEQKLIENILGVIPELNANVSVGGTALLHPAPAVEGAPPPSPVPIISTGNLLNGTVDVASSDPSSSVDVYPNNTAIGSLRRDIKPRNLAENLQRAFQLPPDVGAYHEVPLQGLPPGVNPPEPPPTPTPPPVDGGVDPSPTPSPSPNPSASPSGSPGEGGPEPTPTPSPYFVLYDDLVLQGPAPTSGETFRYADSAKFKISMGCGNRYISSPNTEIYYTGSGIELHDCVLYVAGNLDLSSTRPAAGQSVIMPALRGTNATIIVDGTLIVNNGSLSASDEGMVIYCRRLVSAAQGSYRGLIMVQNSAAICPAYPGAVMTIEGGVVCGGAPIGLCALPPNYNPSVDQGPSQVSVYLNGLHLWSTHLVYNSRYLKTLNRFGPLHVLTLRQIE